MKRKDGKPTPKKGQAKGERGLASNITAPEPNPEHAAKAELQGTLELIGKMEAGVRRSIEREGYSTDLDELGIYVQEPEGAEPVPGPIKNLGMALFELYATQGFVEHGEWHDAIRFMAYAAIDGMAGGQRLYQQGVEAEFEELEAKLDDSRQQLEQVEEKAAAKQQVLEQEVEDAKSLSEDVKAKAERKLARHKRKSTAEIAGNQEQVTNLENNVAEKKVELARLEDMNESLRGEVEDVKSRLSRTLSPKTAKTKEVKRNAFNTKFKSLYQERVNFYVLTLGHTYGKACKETETEFRNKHGGDRRHNKDRIEGLTTNPKPRKKRTPDKFLVTD